MAGQATDPIATWSSLERRGRDGDRTVAQRKTGARRPRSSQPRLQYAGAGGRRDPRHARGARANRGGSALRVAEPDQSPVHHRPDEGTRFSTDVRQHLFPNDDRGRDRDSRGMTIRDAAEADLPAIIDIYNAATASRSSTALFDPVSVEDRLPWFHRHSPNEFPLWVAEIDGQIAGWLSFHEFIRRPAYRGAVEISIYRHEKFRRRGIGRALLGKAIADAARLKMRTLLGYVLGHNETSLALFEQAGFQRWGRLPRIARFEESERDLVSVGRRLA